MKGNHRDQVLLEWYFWIRAGHCLIIEKIDGVPTITRRIDGVPSSYEVLYIGREKYGETFVSIPVAYNPSLANALAERFEAVSEGIALGLLPKKLAKKKQECQWCGLNSSCW
jgi:hypothetical protein